VEHSQLENNPRFSTIYCSLEGEITTLILAKVFSPLSLARERERMSE
jgi:hypothetical protein